MHFSVVGFLFLALSRAPNLNSAKSGTHKSAHACSYFSVNYVAKCFLATFVTKNLACCPVGTEDRNWLEIFI